jgi:hypothetical protein
MKVFLVICAIGVWSWFATVPRPVSVNEIWTPLATR